ncbi:hypothetical protein G7054_g11262 [Neopestalotiopsis clavispora]|nr:hypothetical protein G7054_g11262 [Neopestalotiopsis clavispora]
MSLIAVTAQKLGQHMARQDGLIRTMTAIHRDPRSAAGAGSMTPDEKGRDREQPCGDFSCEWLRASEPQISIYV